MHSYLILPLYLPFQILHTRERIYHLMIFVADRLLQTNLYPRESNSDFAFLLWVLNANTPQSTSNTVLPHQLDYAVLITTPVKLISFSYIILPISVKLLFTTSTLTTGLSLTEVKYFKF